MTEEAKPVEVTDILRDIYSQFEVVLKVANEGMNVTCKKGCHHCCSLLTCISLPEGLLIAKHLLSNTDWESWLPKLRQACQEHDFDGLNKTAFFAKRHRCVFLNEENLCGIYNERPACCRLHLVTSPPEHCEPTPENKDKQTTALNFFELESIVWQLGVELARTNGVGGPMGFCTAPIPVMTLFCLNVLVPPNTQERREVAKACEGLLNPDQWLEKFSRNLMEEGDGITGIDQEQLLKIGKRVFSDPHRVP